jgi:hypothetical protein
VVSKKSGLLFERRLIERYIEVHSLASDLALQFFIGIGKNVCAKFMSWWRCPMFMLNSCRDGDAHDIAGPW